MVRYSHWKLGSPPSLTGSGIPQPFPHLLSICPWLIVADAVPGIGNMQLVSTGLDSQDLCGLLRRDQGAAGGIACHQQQGTADGGQDFHGRAFAHNRRRADGQKGCIELLLGDSPPLDGDLRPAGILLTGGLAFLRLFARTSTSQFQRRCLSSGERVGGSCGTNSAPSSSRTARTTSGHSLATTAATPAPIECPPSRTGPNPKAWMSAATSSAMARRR
jgi:hypothetical protein